MVKDGTEARAQMTRESSVTTTTRSLNGLAAAPRGAERRMTAVLELEPDVVTLLESDAIILVGTVAPDGLPEASRGWGLTVRTDAEPPEVRLLMPEASTRARENLE